MISLRVASSWTLEDYKQQLHHSPGAAESICSSDIKPSEVNGYNLRTGHARRVQVHLRVLDRPMHLSH
jgi:hypothetical protein